MGDPAFKHTIHKYERVRLGTKGFKVYKCVLPNCPHYIREELVAGKMTICWRCGAAIVMTKPMARMKKPHCYDCTREYTQKNEKTAERVYGPEKAEVPMPEDFLKRKLG